MNLGRRPLALAIGALSLVGARPVSAQVPAGGEFRVNDFTTGDQVYPALGVDGAGGFVVVWESRGQDRGTTGIFGRRFTSSGLPAGGEFRVNQYRPGAQARAAVAMDTSGRFVVAWDSPRPGASGYEVRMRLYDADGSPRGREWAVNSYTTEEQFGPVAAPVPGGGFVVAWSSYGQDGSSWSVQARIFDADGLPAGPDFLVNGYTTGTQALPAVAVDASGRFVVAWQSFRQDGSDWGIFARRFAEDGTPAGPEFAVNTWTTSFQRNVTVAAQPSGSFLVGWHSYGQDGDGRGIFARRFDSAGTPAGPEFQVNVQSQEHQYGPRAAASASGDFVIAWDSFGQDGSSYAALGRAFDLEALPFGGEFLVPEATAGAQFGPVVGAGPVGTFVVVWNTPDGSGYGLSARRLSLDLIFRDGFEAP
jgi:hypothetical protein